VGELILVKTDVRFLRVRIVLFALAVIFAVAADVAFVEDQLSSGLDLRRGAHAQANSRVHWIRDGNTRGFENVLFSHASNTRQNVPHYASRMVRSPFFDTDGTISKRFLAVTRDAQANARKKYEQEYLTSITEGGKNTINVPSRLKEWDYAVDPFHLETI
jgi:preprotein translocase subunit SecF